MDATLRGPVSTSADGERPPPGDRPGRPGATGWGALTLGAAAATFGLIVLGGVVRITGSGMGCGDDWPLCKGRIVPPLDVPTLIEYGHRLAALAVSLLVVWVAVAAWRRSRRGLSPGALRLALSAAALLVVQVMLGAVTVWLELPPASVILHLTTAMLLLALLVVLATDAVVGKEGANERGWDGGRLAGAALLAFLVVLAGALVANVEAARACQGFPLCNGEWWPGRSWRAQLHWVHRVAAYGLVAWVIALPFVAVRWGAPRGVRAALGWAAALATGQIAVGAWMVLAGLPTAARAAHVAVGTALFAVLVAAARLASPVTRAQEGPATGARVAVGPEPAGAADAWA